MCVYGPGLLGCRLVSDFLKSWWPSRVRHSRRSVGGNKHEKGCDRPYLNRYSRFSRCSCNGAQMAIKFQTFVGQFSVEACTLARCFRLRTMTALPQLVHPDWLHAPEYYNLQSRTSILEEVIHKPICEVLAAPVLTQNVTVRLTVMIPCYAHQWAICA